MLWNRRIFNRFGVNSLNQPLEVLIPIILLSPPFLFLYNDMKFFHSELTDWSSKPVCSGILVPEDFSLPYWTGKQISNILNKLQASSCMQDWFSLLFFFIFVYFICTFTHCWMDSVSPWWLSVSTGVENTSLQPEKQKVFVHPAKNEMEISGKNIRWSSFCSSFHQLWQKAEIVAESLQLNWLICWTRSVIRAQFRGAVSSLCFTLQVNGGIQQQLEKEVLHYDYHASFFDIFVSLKYSEKSFHHHRHESLIKHLLVSYFIPHSSPFSALSPSSSLLLLLSHSFYQSSGLPLSSWPTPSVSCATGGPSQ